MKTRLSIDKHVVETKLTKVSKKTRRKNARKKRRRHDGSETTSFVHASTEPTPSSRYSQFSSNIWQNSYLNVVKWQCEQQVSYWKNIARRYKVENAYLRGELKKLQEHMADHNVVHDDCTGKEESTVLNNMDEEFISFLEITAKHRLERVRQREEEESD